MAAEAIYRAAQNAPRELWVGAPTIKAMTGTMIAPGILDAMMARRAWEGQMSEEPAFERADNLFNPIDGDPGARGRFTPQERRRAVTASATVLRGAGLAAALGFAAGLIALGRGSRRLGNFSSGDSSNRHPQANRSRP